MNALNTIIIKLTLCLIIGILISYTLNLSIRFALYSNGLAGLLLCINYIHAKRKLYKTSGFGIATYILMITLGVLTYTTHNEKTFKNHYTSLLADTDQSLHTLTFTIKTWLKPSLYHDKYVVELRTIDNIPVRGKLLCNITKDSLKSGYDIDDVLITNTSLDQIPSASNPNQFDYAAYLEKQYIYHQIYSNTYSTKKLGFKKQSVFGYASSLRKTINKQLRLYDFNPNELAVINALLLGQRQDLEQDLYQDYANAGAIHILAVSGLHVGIILLLLHSLLNPLKSIKFGKSIKVIVLIAALWGFAFIAGLSASVTRAVTMFSIFTIAMHLHRKTNIYNTLAISIFILLLCKPMFLFDVGFQMSYLAVIAIVSIQPLLFALWKPKWKITNYFWQIFTVTIAAQIGVIPISLYYFHQFPGLFFISNLVIIPFLGLILGLGILVIVLALCNVLPIQLASLYGELISSMNTIVSWVSKQEQFLFQNISFDITHVVCSYVLIIAIVQLYRKFRFKYVMLFLISVLCVQGVALYTKYKYSNNAFIIFHKNRFSVIGYKYNSNLKIYHNLDSITFKKDKIISNFSVGHFISTTEIDTIKPVYRFQNKTLLIVDSLGIYNVKGFKPHYILLRNSPKINLARLIDSINPEFIIADGSNYRSYVDRWEITCRKHKLPFHNTSKKGAFIIK